MKAMTSAYSATASVSAKPRSTLPNTRGAASGLRRAPCTKLPKIWPMPTPTPASAMVARPAPMSLAAEASILTVLSSIESFCGWKATPSVTRMEGVVEIEAGQDREDVGLQEGDDELQRIEREDEHDRRPAGEDAEHHREASEHLQHGVAGQHVGEQSDREAERPDEIGEDLQRHHEDQEVDRHAL